MRTRKTISLTPTTKLAKALALHPDVLPYVVNLKPHDFERLNTPLMFKLMPPRITLQRLAEMVDKPVGTLIAEIYHAAHMEGPADVNVAEPQPMQPGNPETAPSWVTDDVVEIIDLLAADERLDTDPFMPLFPALKRAKVNDVILLKHKWEPQPLYDVWQKLGVKHFAVQQSADEWWIYLRKRRAGFRS